MAIPPSYRQFLRRFNGGFINISASKPGDEYWDLGSARWNSNWLFGTADVLNEFTVLQDRVDEESGILPFCQTSGQESLVFGPAENGDEPPVLDAFHEYPSSEWGELYPNFESLLRAYISKKGKIKTIAGA